MKKVFKWIGIGFLVFIAVIMVYAILGKEQTLNLEISPVDLRGIPDGEYMGTYDCYRWSNTVVVTVEAHRIMDIEVVKSRTDERALEKI